MKRSYLYIAAFSISLLACNQLDIEPNGSITKKQFYQTESDAIAGVTAVYSALTYESGDQALYGRNLYFLTDMGSDYAAAGASAINAQVRAISALSYDASNDRVALAWKQLYRGINRANVAIDNIPAVTGSEEVKQRLINEARFVRALLYFNAVRLWGAVPLVLHEAESLDNNILKADRTEVDEVYAQIISDLTAAEALPATYSGENVGRATGGAAKALLAKVYLTRGEWQNAREKAEEVINGPYGYELFENFHDIFNPVTKNGKEHIFSAQFENGQSGTTGRTGNTLPGTSFQGFTQIETADIISDVALFYDIYDWEDTRKTISYAKFLYNPVTGSDYVFNKPIFRKYVDTTMITTSQYAASMNFPILRYADVLLIQAEAINELAGESGPEAVAYEAINQIRRRAYGYPVYQSSPVDLAGLTKTTFRQAIQKERLLEFVQEGHRWFDLVRWGTLVEEVKKVPAKSSVSERNLLYPIPQEQHDLNPQGLWQNPGY